MVYLFSTNLKNNKKIRTALSNIYGVGQTRSQQICEKLGISRQLRVKQLTTSQIEKIKFSIIASFMYSTST